MRISLMHRLSTFVGTFMKRTFIIAATYTMLYFLTYMLAGFSYSALFNAPADQSRSISWLYYGIMFTIIPYLGSMVITLAELNRKKQLSKKHIFWLLHTFLVTQAVDKLGVTVLANLMAEGFPWYGHEFPAAGFELLCEELPFYCSGYVKPYLAINTVGSLIIFSTAYVAYRFKIKVLK
jgi:heme/copper-type cytochrome/quinol oxidase subunit 3